MDTFVKNKSEPKRKLWTLGDDLSFSCNKCTSPIEDVDIEGGYAGQGIELFSPLIKYF